MSIHIFFNDAATTEIYTYGHTLALHDALPICRSVEGDLEPGALDKRRPLLGRVSRYGEHRDDEVDVVERAARLRRSLGDRRDEALVEVVHRVDRKSTRLNSSH